MTVSPSAAVASVLEGNGDGWWARQGSNLRPIGYEPTALPLSYEPSVGGSSSVSNAANPVKAGKRRPVDPLEPVIGYSGFVQFYRLADRSIAPLINVSAVWFPWLTLASNLLPYRLFKPRADPLPGGPCRCSS